MTGEQKTFARRVLLLLGPIAVIAVSGWFYVTGGRYITTENAYLKTDIVSIVPEVSGIVKAVEIADNQPVHKGDLLVTIDPSSFEIEKNKAEAELLSAAAQIEAQKTRFRQKDEEIAMAQTELDLAKKVYERRNTLQKQNSGVISPEEMDNATYALKNAEKHITLLQQEKAEILVMLEGDPDIKAEEHPLYQTAQAALERAQLNLGRTGILAPDDGIIHRAPHAGDYAQTGLPLANLAVSEKMWIEANYKETELTSVTPGQKVEIAVDTYPGRVWEGSVDSISPATESEFSILPAQNATGNWVKVVQRIPVRIRIEPQKNAPPLRAGMSAEVTIDTGSWPHMPGFLK